MTPLLPEHHLSDGCVVLDIPSDAVALDPSELSLALGYPGAQPPAGMAGLISSTAGEIHGLCAFRAGYVVLPLAFDPSQPDGLLLATRFFQTGKIIRSQLQGAERAALLLCTIGPEPEQRVNALLKNGEPARGFIADTTASLLAEKTAEALHHQLDLKSAAEGFGTTNRFRLLPEGFCGVHLEDSAFMQPRKSVSAMVGIGRSLKRTEYPCAKCDDPLCLYRKITVEENARKD